MIHLITGNTGAGKTTFAKKLAESLGAILFSIDEWNNELFFPDMKEGDGVDWILERIDRSEKVIWNLCAQLDMQSQDVVLDLGFSKYEHRAKFFALAKEIEIEAQLYFLNYKKETRTNRIKKRNEEKGDTYVMDVDGKMVEFMESWFEAPVEEELQNSIVYDEGSIAQESNGHDYLGVFSDLHKSQLDFCMKLSSGIGNNTNLDILRTYVLDFWKQVLTHQFELEASLYTNMDNSVQPMKKIMEDHIEIESMLKAIASNDSVSKSYLEGLINAIRSHILHKERSLYQFITEELDDYSIKLIQQKTHAFKEVSHEFSNEFWVRN